MLDLKHYMKNIPELTEGLERKGYPTEDITKFVKKLEVLKSKKQEVEKDLAEVNELSKKFGQSKREGLDTQDIAEKVKKKKEGIEAGKQELSKLEEEIEQVSMLFPNIPLADVPMGEGEEDNVEINKVLTRPTYAFEPKQHWDLAEINNWIDFKRGVKLAKTRFSILKGEAARLERALINFFLDENAKKGFEEYSVPYLNNSKMLKGTGQLPKFEDDLFKIKDEDLYLIPTAEVPLTNMFHDEIIEKSEFPVLMTGFTPCFRKEAGSAGKDTRGLIRQHQFSKVEMVAITTPEQSKETFDMMVKNSSDLLTKLGLHHRLVELCDGDLGFSAARTIDLEVWLPGANEYREISSVSNMTDFQARRAKIRYKDDKKNKLANTLNGSALAVGRTIVAIMENYQNEDGTITIPPVLKKYM